MNGREKRGVRLLDKRESKNKMKIDGREISKTILEDLKKRVEKLSKKNVTPNLYIILLSDDLSSASYVKQKILKAEQIGVKITLDRENPKISTEELIKKIQRLNADKNVHGIIVQRPMPKTLDEEKIEEAVDIAKDVDGFNSNSDFKTPVAAAVLKILETVHPKDFEKWIKLQNITVVGKGLTAGGPIIKLLQKNGLTPNIISSKTENRSELLKTSDIVIVAVGKPNVVSKDEIKMGAILVGVGIHREDDQKFHGDYNEKEIEKIASAYTPTPGGVGPVNVSMLLANLVTAAQNLQ